jgi:hypothetical protein
MEKRGQGQSWSFDIILAFVIFVLIIAIFYAILNNDSGKKTEKLQLEANTLSKNLDSDTGLNSVLSVVEEGNVNEPKIQDLYESDYIALKNQFGIKGDFCIYVVDQYGNLISINTTSGNFNGFGNGNLSINEKPCGSIV